MGGIDEGTCQWHESLLWLIAIQHDCNDREKDQETPHVPALAGLTELAAVIETDEEAKQLIENVVDLNALISEMSDLPSKSGVQVHFGTLMTIASRKFCELAKHLQKMKGRIVYRGDSAKDEDGAAAVYHELETNPTSAQGLNAYEALPGNATTTGDAIQAYVKFARPVVLLLKRCTVTPNVGTTPEGSSPPARW